VGILEKCRRDWITENYPTPQSASLQCATATERMAAEFDLRRVRGAPEKLQGYVPADNRKHARNSK